MIEQEKVLGKFTKAEFGFCGYQDAEIGFHFTFEGEGWGIGGYWGQWAMQPTDHTQWTEQERNLGAGTQVIDLAEILKKAKVQQVSDLIGVPVEVTLEGNMLKSWRILEEVL